MRGRASQFDPTTDKEYNDIASASSDNSVAKQSTMNKLSAMKSIPVSWWAWAAQQLKPDSYNWW